MSEVREVLYHGREGWPLYAEIRQREEGVDGPTRANACGGGAWSAPQALITVARHMRRNGCEFRL